MLHQGYLGKGQACDPASESPCPCSVGSTGSDSSLAVGIACAVGEKSRVQGVPSDDGYSTCGILGHSVAYGVVSGLGVVEASADVVVAAVAAAAVPPRCLLQIVF